QKKASLKNSAPTLLGLIVLCAALSIIDPAPAGFDYSGCQRIAVAVCLCVLITKVPPLACDALSRIIDHLGDCTLGVYCLHVLVFNVLDIIRPHGLMRGTPVYALIVFIISLILTFPLRRVTRKCFPLKYIV
ncbi:MAG: hypothetical protein MJ099_03730, partial [Clostridia bacterium]|nr:hypothetical protein [Clostridia bacterium]